VDYKQVKRGSKGQIEVVKRLAVGLTDSE